MAGLENLVKKAFYMGVGIASYANEKAGVVLSDLRTQAQKLADEMVKRGELNTEEARKFVDDLVQQAQQEAVKSSSGDEKKEETGPRRIEIISDDEESTQQEKPEQVDNLRQQVESLQEELRRLRKE
jgi:polyhydroxyalkanoate synthesis regulator phasin